MYTLLISEKPDAAKKIAYALGENVKEIREKKTRYYLFRRNGKNYAVVPAVGHLFTLKAKDGKKWNYPVFENEWVPIYIANPMASYAKNYISNFKKFNENADEIIVCTDWDNEGSVIAYNILRFIFRRKNAERMFFTTLTKDELNNSFENRSPSLDFGMVNAGIARHKLDWLYGINITRALTLSLKKARGGFKLISTGRVQGPTLKILAEREREIMGFKPRDYWELSFVWDGGIKATYENPKIFDEEEAKRVEEKCRECKEAKITKISRRETKIPPPVPFNLTSLQTEAYRQFGYNPYITQQIAQKLYTNALISYPRTSSQKLPQRLNLKSIIKKLSKQNEYKEACNELIRKPALIPHEGKKEDKAHTAIHPTGEVPSNISKQEKNVYDLIVRRFLAVFGREGLKENKVISLEIRGERFISKGSNIIDEGWRRIYGKYAPKVESKLPDVHEGEIAKVEKFSSEKKKTLPPDRYSFAGIVSEMEKRGLGTKATRASIVKTLKDRGYITGERIKVSRLGMGVVEALEKHCPKIVSEDLTKKFERYMELIESNKEMKEEVLAEAEDILINISNEFKDHEDAIGKELKQALEESWKESSRTGEVVGTCPKCGSNLVIMYSKKNGKEFVGCSNYPECSTTYSLPPAKFEFLKKSCGVCGAPLVKIGRNDYELCLNKNCKSRLVGLCNKCGGKIVIRVSKRGSLFAGCSNYPKCKNIYSLPKKDMELIGESCGICHSPLVLLKGKRFCLNKECENHKI